MYTINEPSTSFSHMDIRAEILDEDLAVSIITRGTTEITQQIRDALALRKFLVKYFPLRMNQSNQLNNHLWTTIGRLSAILEKTISLQHP